MPAPPTSTSRRRASRRRPTVAQGGITLAAATALAAAIGGCGADDTLRDAAVAVQVGTIQDIDAYGEPKATQLRQVNVHVRPRCDGEGSDCEGTYSVLVKYRFTPDRPGSARCIDEPTGVNYTQAGFATAVIVPLPGGAPTPSLCTEEAGGLTVAGSLAMSEEANVSDPRPTFGVTMDVVVDRLGTVRYRWSGRDGARCESKVNLATDAVQRSTCDLR